MRGVTPIRDRVRAAIDRLTSRSSFRQRAAAFPLTRPVARRRARALFDLCAGFVYAQILLAVVRLELPQLLLARPLTAPEIADRLALPREKVECLLRAAVSLRLLSARAGERYGLGPLGAALIENPGVVAMIEHHDLLYDDLRDPVALLGTDAPATSLGRYWPYAKALSVDRLEPGAVLPYTALMAASQPMIARDVLAAYKLGRHRCLLDVGGGDGRFLEAALSSAPSLRGVLFDVPAVAARARARFDAGPFGARTIVVGGDFRRDPLPLGADLVTLVRVLHDHDDDAALALLRAARAALPSGGRLLVAEPMADSRSAGPAGDAYFGFYLLAMGSGRPRRIAELRALLREAGFRHARLLRTDTPLLVRVLLATA